MNPLKLTVRVLRRLALTASDNTMRPHLCALRFRQRDVLATDGTILVRAPLPHDPDRDFVLPSIATAAVLSTQCKESDVTITRGDSRTVLETDTGNKFVIVDDDEITVARYPSVEAVINEEQDVGSIGDFHISADMWQRVGKLARDLAPYDRTTNPVRLLKSGSVSKKRPAHISFASVYDDALVVVMPVKTW